MKPQTTQTGRSFSCVSIATLLLASCTSGPQHSMVETAPRVLVSGYSQTTKIPLNVELFLSDELRAAEWHGKGTRGSGNYRLDLGTVLAYNAENVTREVFSEVLVTGGSEGPGQARLPGVLIPRFVNAERYGNTLTILLEWTLRDAEDNVVWIDTIKGEGSSTWSLLSPTEQQSVAVINDLFHKSFTALSTSRAIREFVAKRQKQSSVQP
ncbi:MAG: hypothetical protein AB7G75_17115 [Candidatus Binatia bacterium]